MPQRKVFVNIAVYSPKRRRLALVKSALQEGKYGFLRAQLKRGKTVEKFAKELCIREYMVAPLKMIKLDLFIKTSLIIEHYYLIVSDDYVSHHVILENPGNMYFLPMKERVLNKNVIHKADSIVDNIELYNLVGKVSINGWSIDEIDRAVDYLREIKSMKVPAEYIKKLSINVPHNRGELATCSFAFWHQVYCFFKNKARDAFNPILIKNVQ
jgi:hypothetical protein